MLKRSGNRELVRRWPSPLKCGWRHRGLTSTDHRYLAQPPIVTPATSSWSCRLSPTLSRWPRLAVLSAYEINFGARRLIASFHPGAKPNSQHDLGQRQASPADRALRDGEGSGRVVRPRERVFLCRRSDEHAVIKPNGNQRRRPTCSFFPDVSLDHLRMCGGSQESIVPGTADWPVRCGPPFWAVAAPAAAERGDRAATAVAHRPPGWWLPGQAAVSSARVAAAEGATSV